MKQLVVIVLVLLFVETVAGQEAYSKYTNYFSIEGNVIGSFGGLGFSPTFGLYREGHKFDAGIGIKMYDVWKDRPGILGTYIGYKYYPNKRENPFSLYFGYSNVFTSHYKGKRFPLIYDELTDKDIRPDKVLLLENLIGIGFDYQLGNRLYMLTDFIVGVALDWETFKYSETQMEIGSTGLIRLGLGYNIGWKQAK